MKTSFITFFFGVRWNATLPREYQWGGKLCLLFPPPSTSVREIYRMYIRKKKKNLLTNKFIHCFFFHLRTKPIHTRASANELTRNIKTLGLTVRLTGLNTLFYYVLWSWKLSVPSVDKTKYFDALLKWKKKKSSVEERKVTSAGGGRQRVK